jgi:flagella basal body P-ring formation protein FlgA
MTPAKSAAFSLLSFIALAVTLSGSVTAAETVTSSVSDSLRGKIRLEIGKRFPGARIELSSPIQWTQAVDNPNAARDQNNPASDPHAEIVSINLGDENGRGEIPFSVQTRSPTNSQEGLETSLHTDWGHVSYRAFITARVAVNRILPGQAIDPTQFVPQEIDVASGFNHEIRGLILPAAAEITRLEARQTILEGQPLLTSKVEQMPDVRRGDPVRIELVSGSLVLTTQGTASEPGFLNGQVHVMSQKTKRELVGTLLSDNVVEVRL